MLVVLIGVIWFAAVLLSIADGRKPWVGWSAVVALAVSLAAVVYLAVLVYWGGTLQMVAGSWAPGVGIVLRADALGVTFAALSGFVILASLIYEVMRGVTSRVFPGISLFLATGLTGLFLTGDAFNFYVFFEISMISSYVLVGYGGGPRQTRAAFIFATVNLLGSVMFLIAVAGLYHLTGTLQMSEIAARLQEQTSVSALLIAVTIFVAFGVKLGLFPFHFWLPAVYTGVRPAVAAMLSGALANIGSYGLLRFGADLLPAELEIGSTALVVLGTASIIYGALQAISRRRSSEVIAYSAIGQVGYIMIALAVGGPVGYAAAVLYSIVNSVNKTLLFLCCELRGWLTGTIFVIGVFSVAGLPPASGFIGKAALFQAGVVEGSWVLVGLVFLGGALSFVYMFQIYQRTYWGETEPDSGDSPKPSPVRMRAVVLGVAVIVVATGLWPEPLLFVSERAANVLVGGR